METKDPALTKARIADGDATDINDSSHVNSNPNIKNSTVHDNDIADPADQKGTQTLQETVIGTRYVSDDINHGKHMHEDIHHNNYNVMSTDDGIENYTTINKGIENYTTINKGTETFQETVIDKKRVIDSEHVNDGDNAARQPDRRDQEGSAFDEGVNEHNVGSEAPKSHEITDMNRYANIDNAQTRILNPHEKD